ncbi:MAG: hypothetical protein AAGD10_01245 [Myxococcota bacterium]
MASADAVDDEKARTFARAFYARGGAQHPFRAFAEARRAVGPLEGIRIYGVPDAH